MGRLLTIPLTSAIRVTSSSWVGWACPIPNSITSNTRRTIPIWCFHTPPKCDACGGLNIHSQPCSAVNLWICVWSISASASSNCDFPPTKLVPWSHLSFATGPRMVRNRRSAQMNELASNGAATQTGKDESPALGVHCATSESSCGDLPRT